MLPAGSRASSARGERPGYASIFVATAIPKQEPGPACCSLLFLPLLQPFRDCLLRLNEKFSATFNHRLSETDQKIWVLFNCTRDAIVSSGKKCPYLLVRALLVKLFLMRKSLLYQLHYAKNMISVYGFTVFFLARL